MVDTIFGPMPRSLVAVFYVVTATASAIALFWPLFTNKRIPELWADWRGAAMAEQVTVGASWSSWVPTILAVLTVALLLANALWLYTRSQPAISAYMRGPVSAHTQADKLVILLPLAIGNNTESIRRVIQWAASIQREGLATESLEVLREIDLAVGNLVVDGRVMQGRIGTESLLPTIFARTTAQSKASVHGLLALASTHLRAEVLTNAIIEVRFKDDSGREYLFRTPKMAQGEVKVMPPSRPTADSK